MLAGILAIAAIIYVAGRAPHAYLAADDFQWLQARWGIDWTRLLDPAQYHFFRPVVQAWFAGATAACGPSESCYHWLSLGVHVLNVALVALVGAAITGRRAFGLLSALLFAVQPAYTQAVVWVSAVTALLCTTFLLLSLYCAARAWHSAGRARWWEIGALVAGAASMFTHEAGVITPLLVALATAALAPSARRSKLLAAGFAIVLAVFAVTTYDISRRNPVLAAGSYRIGVHMLQHALDYLATLWVAPHHAASYVAVVALTVGLAGLSRLSRAGCVALVIMLVPYLGFTWGNVSRYAYLPAIGFSWTLAAALLAVHARLAARPGATGRATPVVGLIAATLIVRFGAFAVRGSRDEVFRIESYREYAAAVMNAHPVPGVELHVQPPSSPYVDVRFTEVLLRWAYDMPTLRVVVDPR
jgi:hypothetical protein